MSAGRGLPGPVTAVTSRLLRSAARRWPDDERADALREWEAELHALGGGGIARVVRALRYAASLAVARPPQARQSGVSQPRAGAAFVPVLAAIAGPAVVCTGLFLALSAVGLFVDAALQRPHGGIAVVVAVTALPTCVALAAGWFGAQVGRRLGRTSIGSGAQIALVGIGLALLVPPAITANLTEISFQTNGLMAIVAAGVLIVGIAATSGLARRSRLAAVGSVLVLSDVAVALVGLIPPATAGIPVASSPLWFPQNVFWPWDNLMPDLGIVSESVGWLGNLPAAVFVLAAFGVTMVRTARQTAPSPAAVRAEPVDGVQHGR